MIYFIVTYTHPDEQGWKEHLRPHLDFLVEIVDKGKIFSSGPLIDVPVRSSAIIFQVTDKNEVEQLLRQGPFMIHHQVGKCVVK